MSEIKEALIQKFTEIFGYDPIDSYQPRIDNAYKVMCQERGKKSDIIYINDTSIMSNGKSGLVFTVDSVCVKDAANWDSKFIVKYEDIDYTYHDSSKDRLELNTKYDKSYVLSNTVPRHQKDKYMEFIDYAISLYNENDKLEW